MNVQLKMTFNLTDDVMNYSAPIGSFKAFGYKAIVTLNYTK